MRLKFRNNWANTEYEAIIERRPRGRRRTDENGLQNKANEVRVGEVKQKREAGERRESRESNAEVQTQKQQNRFRFRFRGREGLELELELDLDLEAATGWS